LLDAPSYESLNGLSLDDAATLRCYLLAWQLVLGCLTNPSLRVKTDYNQALKSGGYVKPLLILISNILGLSLAEPLDLKKAQLDNSMIEKYDLSHAEASTSTEQELRWLLVNSYYLCLKYLPDSVKGWNGDCPSRQTKLTVGAWTESFFSPLIIEGAFQDVEKWAIEQEADESENKLGVKISRRSREVIASFEIEEQTMAIRVILPANFPLSGVEVETINRVAALDSVWANWLLQVKGAINLCVSFLWATILNNSSNFLLEWVC